MDCRNRRRHATTLFECVVALFLLSVAAASMVQARVQFNQTIAMQREATFFRSQVLAMRERVGMWSFDDLERSKINELPVPTSLPEGVSDVHWLMQVQTQEPSDSFKQVTIGIAWKVRDVEHHTGPLTFWIASNSKDVP